MRSEPFVEPKKKVIGAEVGQLLVSRVFFLPIDEAAFSIEGARLLGELKEDSVYGVTQSKPKI